jgi:hypothetical protein
MSAAKSLTVIAVMTVILGLSSPSALCAEVQVNTQISPSTICYRSAGTWVCVWHVTCFLSHLDRRPKTREAGSDETR